jgi:hypothetical protein
VSCAHLDTRALHRTDSTAVVHGPRSRQHHAICVTTRLHSVLRLYHPGQERHRTVTPSVSPRHPHLPRILHYSFTTFPSYFLPHSDPYDPANGLAYHRLQISASAWIYPHTYKAPSTTTAFALCHDDATWIWLGRSPPRPFFNSRHVSPQYGYPSCHPSASRSTSGCPLHYRHGQ